MTVMGSDGPDRFLGSLQRVKQLGTRKRPSPPPRGVHELTRIKIQKNVDDVVYDVLGVRLGPRK